MLSDLRSTVQTTQAPNNGRASQYGDIATRRELKRQRREAEQEQQRARLASERRRRRLLLGSGVAVVVILFGALVYWLARPIDEGAVQSFANQGGIHIARGQTHPPYNSLPPTSGWHYADAVAPWGIASTQIPDEVQVHNLEHGGILIQYDCPSGCPDMVTKLETIGRTYPSKVVVAPYAGIGHPIAVTAWTKLAYLDQVDEGFIRDFIARYKNKGPEQVPD
jgi:hypothetical protein